MPTKETPRNAVLDTTLIDEALAANKRSVLIEKILHATVTKILGTTFLLSALFSISFLLAYQQIKRKEVNDTLKQVPKAEVTVPNIVEYANNLGNTFSDDYWGFSFEYPQTWTAEIKSEELQDFFFENPVATLTLDFDINDDFEVTKGAYIFFQYVPAITQKAKTFEDLLGNGATFSQEDFLLDNQPAKITEEEGTLTIYFKYPKPQQETNYSFIGVHSSKEEFSRYKEEFLEMMKTFKFMNTNSEVESSNTTQFCGGIAGITCAEGYRCALDGTYPDAGGTCVLE